MPKKHLSLAVLLLVSTILISGCGKKPANQAAPVNNAPDNQNQEQNQAQVENKTTETVNPSGSYTINELFTMNRPMKCAWKESTAEGDVTNIIYINGKKFYQDVTMSDVGHSFAISNGEYLYIWNDFTSAASKMKFDDIKATTESEPEKPQDSAGLDQKRDFICEKWTVNEAIFTPPQDKNFKDVSEEMNQAVQELNNGGLEKTKQQVCDLCQGAPTPELKDQCLTNAQCN